METPAVPQQEPGRPEGGRKPLVRPLPQKTPEKPVEAPKPPPQVETASQPEVILAGGFVKPKRKYKKRPRVIEVSCVEPDEKLTAGERRKYSQLVSDDPPPIREIDRRYIKKFDWKLDATPVSEVLTEEGLDELPKSRRGDLMRELPSYWRAKVGLTRTFNPETYPVGKPKGYITAATAYTMVSTLPPKDLLRLSKGLRPKEKGWETRKITAQLQRAAREYLSAGPRGIPQEINNRIDGPVVQRTEEIKVSYVVEVPPLMTPEDWEANARKALKSGEGDERG